MCKDGEEDRICFRNEEDQEDMDVERISTLHIPDTGELGVGNYTVRCVASQTINDSFRNDRSFETSFEDELSVNENALLTITDPPGELLS